jgi:hypothetical protein
MDGERTSRPVVDNLQILLIYEILLGVFNKNKGPRFLKLRIQPLQNRGRWEMDGTKEKGGAKDNSIKDDPRLKGHGDGNSKMLCWGGGSR